MAVEDKTGITKEEISMISNKKPPLIPTTVGPAPVEPTSNDRAAQLAVTNDPVTITTNDAVATVTNAPVTITTNDAVETPDDTDGAAGVLESLFGPAAPPTSNRAGVFVEPLPDDNDFARFLNAMYQRNEAGEIIGMGLVELLGDRERDLGLRHRADYAPPPRRGRRAARARDQAGPRLQEDPTHRPAP